MHEIPIAQLMTAQPESVGIHTFIFDAAAYMSKCRYSCLVVVDEHTFPIGIITERDIVRLYSQKQFDGNLTVGDLMTSPVTTFDVEGCLFDAMVLVRAEKIRHLPVVNDEGVLVGLLTQTDLTQAYFFIIEQQRSLLKRLVDERTTELQEVNEELQSLALEDALLSLGNRRAMEVDFDHTHSASVRYDRVYSVMMIDVDYFKKYNDAFGHQKGDETLVKIARTISSCARDSDRIYRYGGEEMLLLLPETPLDGSLKLAQRIVDSVADLNIDHPESSHGKITISVGVHCYRPPGNTATDGWLDVVNQADERLYAAKELGRNCVVGDDESDDSLGQLVS